MAAHDQWLREHAAPKQAIQSALRFDPFDVLTKEAAGHTPATRADVDALREEVRQLRGALVRADSPIATGPDVLHEFAQLTRYGRFFNKTSDF